MMEVTITDLGREIMERRYKNVVAKLTREMKEETVVKSDKSRVVYYCRISSHSV